MTADMKSTGGPTRVIAMMNQKGGVGKTTTTVNLAAALAAAGRRTLLVDLDPQAHATLHLGADDASVDEGLPGGGDPASSASDEQKADETAAVPSAYEIMIDGTPPRPMPVRPGLDLIPAETDLAAAESELVRIENPLGVLRAALEPVLNGDGDGGSGGGGGRSGYEFCLIDCPPSLGRLTLAGLVAAREVMIPMQAHFLALQGMSKLLETVRMVRGTRGSPGPNPRLRVAGVVLCMHDRQATHTQDVVAELQDFFKAAREDEDAPWRFARVYSPPIRRNIKLAECPSFGQTIFDYAPDANGAADYAALAANLLEEWDAAVAKLNSADAAATLPPADRAHADNPTGASAEAPTSLPAGSPADAPIG